MATTSSDLFAAAAERLDALAEFPMTAFSLDIKRTPPHLSLSGSAEAEYRLVQPSAGGPTSIVLRAVGTVVKSSIFSTVVRLPGWEGVSHMAVASMDGEWTLRLTEVGTLNSNGEFKSEKHLEGVEHTGPSNKVTTKAGAAITRVAQRLVYRLSRVDLL